MGDLIAMQEHTKTKIFKHKDDLETKNLINMFVNQVTVFENEIKLRCIMAHDDILTDIQS